MEQAELAPRQAMAVKLLPNTTHRWCLLEGENSDSLINLSFSAREFIIGPETTQLQINDNPQLTLMAIWIPGGIRVLREEDIEQGPILDLGKYFSIYLTRIHTLIHPDGRIFHNTNLYLHELNRGETPRLSRTVERLRKAYGDDNPAHNPNFKERLSRI